MAEATLRDVFVDELKDMYHAERQITKALPKMIKAADADELREALDNHLQETETQIERLDQVFELLDMKPKAVQCEGMAGIIEESKEVLSKDLSGAVRDAALIASAQRVEHYEIAAYGTMVAWARELGLDDAADLLETTLEEEKAADEKLNEIAEGGINAAAAAGEAAEEQPAAQPRAMAADRPRGSRSRRR